MFLKYYRHTLSTWCKLKTINLVRNVANQATKDNKFEEMEIKVPWGKLCGKYWGPRDVQPIIAIHGSLSNAGSFDTLAPRLPENVSLFAPDFPGHGLSSWLPRGMQYTGLSYIQIFDRVKEHFKIDKLKLLSHSYGGALSFLYTSIYSNDVRYVITLDTYKVYTFRDTFTLSQLAKYRDMFFKIEKLTIPRKLYTTETAIKQMMSEVKNSLDENSSKLIMKRGMTKQPDGMLYFNYDPRILLFSPDITTSYDQVKIMAKQIRCPFLFIETDQFEPIDDMERYYEPLEVIKEHSEDFQHHKLSGNHFIQMNDPEQIARIINPFILKHAD